MTGLPLISMVVTKSSIRGYTTHAPAREKAVLLQLQLVIYRAKLTLVFVYHCGPHRMTVFDKAVYLEIVITSLLGRVVAKPPTTHPRSEHQVLTPSSTPYNVHVKY
jgi:uncharacterized membrane protein YadS